MPYFHVRISQNVSSEYIVNAPDRDAAEDKALTADASKKCDNKTVVRLRTDTSASMDISDSEKTHWTEALKQQKVK